VSLGSSHQQSNNADLTPRIVREGVSGVISAQWSSLHWREAPRLHNKHGFVDGCCYVVMRQWQ